MNWLTLAVLATAASTPGGERLPPPKLELPAATGRLAVVAFGRCDDGRLGQATRELREELTHLRVGPVLSEDETARPARGLAVGRSTSEGIRQAIRAAVLEFAAERYEKAETMLRALLPTIDRLPPGAERWNLSSMARSQLAQVLFFSERKREAESIFMEILRVEEGLRLDPLTAPPSLRRALDQVRNTRLKRARRVILHVTSIEPNQSVFLNGREVGQTPFARGVAEGSYEVIVGLPSSYGFPRLLELRADVDIDVDVAREARLKADSGPCYESSASQDDGVAAAALLAGALSVEHLAGVRIHQREDGEYVAVTLYQAGRDVREGRLRIELGLLPSSKRLATFVLTGSGLEEHTTPHQALPAAAAPRASVEEKPAASVARPVGYGLIGLGAASVIASGVLILEAGNAQRKLNGLWAGDHYPESEHARVSDATARRDRCQLWAKISGGLGVLSAAVGGIVLWKAPSGASVAAGPAVGGGTVAIRY